MGLDYENFRNIYKKLQLAHNPLVAKIRGEFLEKESQFFREYIRDQKVLVAGSGLGHDSVELGGYNEQVVGIELLPNLLGYSKKYENKKITFLRGDIRNLSFQDNSFDSSVLNMGTIGNFDNKEEVISELSRVAERFYFDFYLNTDYALKKRKKMYEEEGWQNVQIKGYEIISDDGLHSKPIRIKELESIIKNVGAKMKITKLCDIALLAKITKS